MSVPCCHRRLFPTQTCPCIWPWCTFAPAACRSLCIHNPRAERLPDKILTEEASENTFFGEYSVWDGHFSKCTAGVIQNPGSKNKILDLFLLKLYSDRLCGFHGLWDFMDTQILWTFRLHRHTRGHTSILWKSHSLQRTPHTPSLPCAFPRWEEMGTGSFSLGALH